MKHWLLLTVISLIVWGPGAAQITIHSDDFFPEVGDTLFTAVDNLPSSISMTPPGENQSWDFTTLQSPFTRAAVVRPASQGTGNFEFPGADQVIRLGENSEAYYRVTDNTYELLGFYGDDPIGLGLNLATRYNPAVIERRAPMSYGDENQTTFALLLPFATDDLPSGIFENLPITPDSLRIRLNSQRTDVVDAWGSLIVPGGIYDVLREKRTEVRTVRLEARIGFLPWVDVTDLIPNSDLLGDFTTYTYHFFSDETKEPIAVVTMNQNDDAPVQVVYKANEMMTSVQEITSLRPGVYAYPNPAIVNVRFEFSNLSAGRYTLTIYNILAMEVWSRTYYIDGSRTEKVDVSNLRKGTYLYSLTNDQGKILSTRRLIVVRP